MHSIDFYNLPGGLVEMVLNSFEGLICEGEGNRGNVISSRGSFCIESLPFVLSSSAKGEKKIGFN